MHTLLRPVEFQFHDQRIFKKLHRIPLMGTYDLCMIVSLDGNLSVSPTRKTLMLRHSFIQCSWPIACLHLPLNRLDDSLQHFATSSSVLVLLSTGRLPLPSQSGRICGRDHVHQTGQRMGSRPKTKYWYCFILYCTIPSWIELSSSLLPPESFW